MSRRLEARSGKKEKTKRSAFDGRRAGETAKLTSRRPGSRRLDSKGMHAVDTVLMMIIVALTILIGIMLIVKFNVFSLETNQDIECASQVQISSAITTATKEIKSPDIICPTRLVEIKSDDETAVKKQIADQMIKCWNTWGKGEKMLFGDKEGVYCHVCSMVTVDGVGSVGDFGNYLDKTIAKTDRETKESWTYSALLQGKKEGTYFQDKEFEGKTTQAIDTKQPLAVVFFYAKGMRWQESLRNTIIGQPASGAIGGAVTAGIIASYTGVGIPVGVLMVGGGATAGLGASIWGRADSSYMALVVVRPLTREQIAALKCDYAPAKSG